MTAQQPVEDIYPLSPMQQGMLFHTLYAPDSGVYISQTSFRVSGEFNPASFKRALACVVERHAVLRSSFVWKDLDQPVQVVYRNVSIPVREEDWSGLPEVEHRQRLEEYLAQDAVQAFDLGRPPLMRFLLARERKSSFRLVWSLHLLLVDGWSTARIMGELFTCHEAFRHELAPRIEPPRRFRDYIAWLARQDAQQAEGFWRRELAGVREPTPLPGDRGPGREPALSQSRILLGEEASEALQAFARANRLTVSTLIQGAWSLLISRMSGRQEVVFGVTIAGRPPELPGAEAMVGPFTNTLPLRAEAAPEARLRPWLQQLQDRHSEARQFEHVPLVKIQGWSDLPRGVPLFESLMVFESFPVDTALRQRRNGLAIDDFRTREVTNYPLVLVGHPGPRLTLTLSWDRSRFEAGTADRLLGYLVRLLEDMVERPEASLESLSHLPSWERHQLLVEWNDTRVAGAPPESVVDRFAAQVESTPEATAIVWRPNAGAGASLTYRELNRAANELANRLIAAGVQAETRVALLAERSPELVTGILGILKAGGAYLPLDPAYPAERLRFLLEDSEASVLVAPPHLLDRLPEAGAEVVLLAPRAGEGSDRDPEHRPRPGDLAYMIYTSGTTGAPKAVLVEHGSLAHTLRAVRNAFGFRSTDRMPCLAPFSFDIFLFELFGPLLSGGTSVLLDLRPAPDLDLVAEELEEATLFHAVPALMRQIVQTVERAGAEKDSRLRGIFVGGDAVPPELLADLRRTFPRARTWVLYGPTESTIVCTSRAVSEGDDRPWIGRPLPDAVVRLHDPHGRPLPIGAPGEIYVGGPGVARGYWNRPDLTAERFVPAAGERFFRTGDLARFLPNGDLVFLGRADHQVKVRGFRIELGEVEAALASLEGVREVVLVAREDHPGDRRLVAYVVGDVAVEELRRSLRERLPDYMVPAAFVALPALPLTPNGKVDRKALPAPEWQNVGEEYQAPRNPVEEVVAGIWAEILGVERVGRADHFFALGGHSLLATRVISRLRHAFDVEIPLRDLFESPTLADLAARVETARRAGAGPLTPPLVPGPRQGPLPLSFAQQRLWFIDQLEPGSSLYNMPVALRVEGPLQPSVLEACLSEIVRRHETLRTVFAELEGSPVQVIRPPAAFVLSLIDLSGLPESVREALLLDLTTEEVDRPFDLSRGPLLRGMLLRLGEDDHLFTLVVHHIVSDGWSMGILTREITVLYAAFSKGGPSPLAELPVQYADFAVWQRSWLHGETLENEIAYWRQQLAGLPPLLELPTDRLRPAVQSYRGGARPLHLPAGLIRQAHALGRSEGATLFMVLLAGFQAVLARYSRQQDFAVGTLVAGRNRTEIEGLIGFFLNTLALRSHLPRGLSFRELLVQARETALAAHLHQDVPFEKLVQELTPERSLAHTPLFQVMLVLQNAPAESLEIPDLRLRPVSKGVSTEQFDLLLSVWEEPGGLFGMLEHATDLFDASTIDRLILHYETLLTAALTAPDSAASELALLSPAERHQLLAEWNDTAVPLPQEPLLRDLFAAQAALTPDAPAASFQGESLTYAALAARVERLADRLRRLGCSPESRVGVALERSLDLLVAFLGVLEAGAVYVPLDPEYPCERLAYLLEDSRPAALLTQESLRDRLPLPEGLPVLMPDALPEADGRPAPAVRQSPGGDLLAYVIYTSGSTGRPKGAMVSHGGMINHLRAKIADLGLAAHSRVAQTASQCFDISVWQLLAPLLAGGSVHIADEPTVHDPELLLRFAARERITVLEVVPSLLSGMLDPLAASGGTIDLSRLEWMIVTGEACPPDLADRWLALAPHTRLLNAYGPTECSDDVTHYERVRPGSRPEPSLPIGRPVANTRIHVLDPGGRPAPQGVPGELCVAGRGVGRGYLGLPDRTAQVFVPDAWSGEPGSRLYRTGDLARWRTDGTLEFLGRLDHQVKVRGFRIELGEIESLLVAFEGVHEAVVLVRQDTPGDQRLVAYVTGDVAAEALRRSLSEQLPDYMVPAAFVTLAALPLTPNGKVDRKALPAPEWQDAEESHRVPRTPVEEVLAGLWAELLGLERVGRGGHFFDLGGHSLLATRVMSRLRSTFGVEMPLRDLFEAPVLADLAARVEAALRAGPGRLAPPLVPAPRHAPAPLSFAQQRLWFIDQLEPASPLYNMPVALRVVGPLSHSVLAACLGEIVRRHETLRTVFAELEGSPVQVIRPPAPFALGLVDLSGLPEGRREALALTLAGEEARRPFGLAGDPLLRGVLLRLEKEDWVVALTMHHIASDAWSMGILVREVTALYAAFAQGRPSSLPELPIQYVDFAVWQRSWLFGEALEEEISFWRRQLAGLPPRIELPTDRPRPAVQSFRGASRPVLLPAGLTRQVRALGQREGATPFMVLLAGFQALLARYSGQQDLAVGTAVAGRNRVEIEGLIGFFINTLVMRGDLAGEPSVRELLGRVRETALAAHMHQDLPFEKLVQELAPERSLAYSPLFQVMLILQNAPVESLGIEELRLQPLVRSGTTAKFDLTLDLEERNGELAGTVQYATDLFDATTIDRLILHYERLLAAAVAAPEQAALALPLLRGAERQQVLVEWNAQPALPPGPSLPERFFAVAARSPEAVALRLGSGSLTYGELGRRVRRRAAELSARGVGPETVTALYLDRSFEMVEAVLAVLAAGGAFVALDPRSTGWALASSLDQADPGCLLTQERLRGRLPRRSGMEVLTVDGDGGTGGAGRSLPVPIAPGSLAYVSFTSGSTGAPKGILGAHGAVAGYLDYLEARWPLSTADRVLQLARLSFDASIRDLLYPLTRGAGVVLLAEDEARDPAALLREARAQGVTCILSAVPSLLHALVETAAPGEGGETLRLVLASGEPLPLALCRRVRDVFGPSVLIANQYGPSECTLTATVHLVPSTAPSEGMAPAGRPIPGMRCRVLDSRLLEVPAGVAGQVFLGGAGVTRGYLGRPDLTAERFLPDPFSTEPGERLYGTGDLGRQRPDGVLELQGRLDHQVKIRGIRLELGEVEAALAAHPEVEAAVAAVCDGRLVAYVVGRGGPPRADGLRPFLATRLPDHAVPSLFIPLEALPLSANGKVDRKSLPAPERQRSEEGYLAPRTPVEEILSGIWAELLGLERVGATDHFFDLGGHSLLATRVMSRLRSAFGVEMPLRDLFEAPALADLASRVESARQAGAGPFVPPLVPTPRQGPLPLSFAQQRLWFIDQLEPGSPLYNMPVALRAEGPLDSGVLELTLGEVVRRHEALRTVFAVRDGVPVQVIQPPAPFPLPVVDLSGLPEREREALARALTGEEAARPFDLTRGPLLRGVLLRLAEADHVAALTLHHIASDGWSMGILVREVTALYAAFADARPSPLPELPVQYADFAMWQRSWLHGERLASEISYWRHQLAGLPPLLALPTDRPRPAVQSFRGASRLVRLPAGLTQSLKTLSRSEGVTLFMALLAAFQALLARYSGQQDLAVGSPVSGRNQVETEGLIGFFVNALALRGDLAGAPSFRELLRRTRETALAAQTHQDVPFEKLIEELAPERSLAHTPLFQVLLVLQNAPEEILEIPGLRLRSVGTAGRMARFDLALNLAERDGGLGGLVEYATDLLDGTTIDRLIGHFEGLLTAAPATPDLTVSALPLLTGAERHQLETEWNDAAAPAAPGVVELFAAQARRSPEAVAVALAGDEGRDLTYRELARRADRLAGRLRALGVGPEVPVGLCVEQTPELAVAVLGIFKSGGALLALDPTHPPARLAFLLQDAAVPVLVTEPRLLASLPLHAARLVLLEGEEGAEEGPLPTAGPRPGDLAYLIYTSGTTGRPKAVQVEHGMLAATLAATQGQFRFAPGDRMPCLALPTFDISLFELLSPLLTGGTAVLFPLRPTLDVERLVGHLGEMTCLHAVPALMRGILESVRRRGAAAPDVGRMRAVFVGGDVVPAELLADLRETFPAARVWVLYGPTEGTIVCAAHPVPPPPAPVRPLLGRPLAGALLQVCSADGEPLPVGVPGELWIGGAGVTRGYLGRDELTAERYVRRGNERFYRTGDRVRRLADGTLDFLGRIDHQVKIRGFRIEPGEIEETLMSLAGVREAAVVVRDDQPGTGAGDRRLVAYVVGDIPAEELRRALRERLPDYMMPAALVELPALPLTPNGKVDRNALPAPERQDAGEGYRAPRTSVEEALAGIWADLLGVERVGTRDDFFALGGHSLLATRVVSRIRSAFQVEVPVRSLFDEPTLGGLAAQVERALRSGGEVEPPISPVPRSGPLPLSFAQQQLWVLDQMAPGRADYNIPFAVRLEGALDVAALAATLSGIAGRHEALRTVFRLVDGEPVQEVRPLAAMPLPLVDLSGLPPALRRSESGRLALVEARTPFDLGRGPLMRAALLRLDAGEHLALLTLHHIVSDGWSTGILVSEIGALYPALVRGERPQLPELPVQYADFACWQRRWLSGDRFDSQLRYWKRQLADLPGLHLPTDRPRPPVQTFRGRRRPAALPADVVQKLRGLATEESTSLFVPLLAGLATVLHQISGQDDVAIGTDVANRTRQEVEGLIGFFVNQLVMRVDLAGDPTFRELLRRTRETALAAWVHQDVPFERLVATLLTERDPSRSPLFQVKLVLQNAPTEGLTLPGLTLGLLALDTGSAKHDLLFNLIESEAGLSGTLEYNTDLFDEATMKRWLDRFHGLLGCAAERPDDRLSGLLAAEARPRSGRSGRRPVRGIEVR